jgi:prepilin-type N-terminal cleavage/methylation domain-containing protein
MKLLKGRNKTGGSEKGFTLIELLVVIAIIGILSSIVLASLNTARGKGANAAIKGNLANMRAQAQIYYDTSSSFGAQWNVQACPATVGAANGTLFADPNINAMINAAASAGTGISNTRCYVDSTGQYWAVSAGLKVGEGANGTITNWCVDGKGNSMGRTNTLQAGSTDCTN